LGKETGGGQDGRNRSDQVNLVHGVFWVGLICVASAEDS
jgi:hypothetical protein